jgi:hypothetical protein
MIRETGLEAGAVIPSLQKTGASSNSQLGLQLSLGVTPILFILTTRTPAFHPERPGPLCDQVMGQCYGLQDRA